MKQSLTGKNALVCGGSAGIGLAAARELAALGANVTILARTANAEFPSLQLDLADTDELIPVIERQSKPVFHILVNNSGGPPPGSIVNATADHFLIAFRQQLLAAHLLAQWLLPTMKADGYGRVVNVVSTSVREPIAGLGVSNTIRAAVAAWAKTLSREVAPFGITVNNVLPGATRTARLVGIIERKAASGISKDEIEKQMLGEIPLGRFGEPAEIGTVIAFLASPAAAYITGVSIPVDGGRLHCV